MMFEVERITKECIRWIREFFEENGKDCQAVAGISGGKDSSVAAALCVRALGKDRVMGVLMPNKVQEDIEDALSLCRHLEIPHVVVDIHEAVKAIENQMGSLPESTQRKINLPPRVRMTALYAVSQSVNGRVVNTCNLSENYIGYSTRYGDAAGDFSPLGQLTASEVVKMGDFLSLPQHLSHKAPSDGLCGKTDEENIGFTYAVLDRYIREGLCDDEMIRKKIDALHAKNLFKMRMMPEFPVNLACGGQGRRA